MKGRQVLIPHCWRSLPPCQPAWDHTPSRDGYRNCSRFDHTTYCNEDFKSLIPLCPIMGVVEETLMNHYHYDDTQNEICCLFGEESIKRHAICSADFEGQCQYQDFW